MGLSLAISTVAFVDGAPNTSYSMANELANIRMKMEANLAIEFFNNAVEMLKDNEKSPNGNDTINDDLCKRHLDKILTGISSYEQWALEFPDSWGRLPFGFFRDHTISMGAFEQCMNLAHQFSDNTADLKGQYCLAKVPVKDFVNQVNSANRARISYKYKQPEFVDLGICIPSSCSATMGDKVLKSVISRLLHYEVNGTMVHPNFCKRDEPVVLRPIDIFAICFFSFIILCMIASSIYDYFKTQKGEPKSDLFVAFSVLSNAPKIFTVKSIESPNIIHCLGGLRCISMMWVVFGHGYMTFGYELPHINRNEVYAWFHTSYSMLVQNGTLCVDTFFLMSGLLVLWGAFREMERTKGYLNIKMMYFHRYVRLTPVVAVVILYIMSFYKYSGAGPMWMKIGTQDKRCSDTWWATLLYVQNYVYPNRFCMSQSWYLAVDTQLYFLSPLVLIPLWKWGKKALVPIGIFGLLCLGCTFATFLHHNFTLFRIEDNNVDARQRLTYYPTHTRIPTWLIGIIFGYFMFKKNRGKRIPLATHWVILGWILSLGTMLTCLWGPYWRLLPQSPPSPIIEGAFYEPLSRSGWALAIAWIVWACYNGHGGIINDFLSWNFFTALSRLSYCMYCIHRIVQLVNAARLQTDTHFSNYDATLYWWHDFGISLTASIFATLAFEAPILGIEKAIFGRGSSKPKDNPTTVSKVPGGTCVTVTEITVPAESATETNTPKALN